jgi:hypothetical protein
MADDPAQFIHAPLGQRGSGRVRYGAAMLLWQRGLISAEVLEVYRVASAHDGRDPLAELRSLGLPPPDVPADNLYKLEDTPQDQVSDGMRASLPPPKA